MTPSSPQLLLIAVASLAMLYVVLSAIGRTAISLASTDISDRRAGEAQRRAENAAAEAAGRAAALEPLALNPDGTIEDPIVAEIERPEP